MPQLARVLNACQVAQFRHGGPRHGKRDTAQGLEGLDHRREAPGVALLVALECQTPQTVTLCRDRLDVFLQDDLLRRCGTHHRAAPAQGAGRQLARPVERRSCRSTQAWRRRVAACRSRRVSSRARRRSRIASSSTAGTYPGVRSPARMSRANGLASRRSVVTRSPAFLGINEGATTQQT